MDAHARFVGAEIGALEKANIVAGKHGTFVLCRQRQHLRLDPGLRLAAGSRDLQVEPVAEYVPPAVE